MVPLYHGGFDKSSQLSFLRSTKSQLTTERNLSTDNAKTSTEAYAKIIARCSAPDSDSLAVLATHNIPSTESRRCLACLLRTTIVEQQSQHASESLLEAALARPTTPVRTPLVLPDPCSAIVAPGVTSTSQRHRDTSPLLGAGDDGVMHASTPAYSTPDS
ncbi:hypothetical protein E2C01_019883 [Portunus trituberculatus]|uniref:Uncharacterized protein n=1 Tax=Portunus trituberculatus TaxID=210409 RepID=A0A5B7E0M1_PORTR|nr:hypothetical protein [Portunus trituberculatus]